MVRSVPPDRMQDGQFPQSDNALLYKGFLNVAPGFTQFSAGQVLAGGAVMDIDEFPMHNGTTWLLVKTTSSIYRFDIAGTNLFLDQTRQIVGAPVYVQNPSGGAPVPSQGPSMKSRVDFTTSRPEGWPPTVGGGRAVYTTLVAPQTVTYTGSLDDFWQSDLIVNPGTNELIYVTTNNLRDPVQYWDGVAGNRFA